MSADRYRALSRFVLIVLSACGSAGDARVDASSPEVDSASEDSDAVDANNLVDADSGSDVVTECVPCTGLTHCVDGSCVPYPDCLRGCDPEEVCRQGACLPHDADPDRDGIPAADDCNELDAHVFPGQADRCNGIDDDCDGDTDEGDSESLCGGDARCINGACTCVEVPDPGLRPPCEGAIDLGVLHDGQHTDVGQIATVDFSTLSDLWIRFRGVDDPESANESGSFCDNLHVRVHILNDPDGTYRFDVHRGSCGVPAETEHGSVFIASGTDYRYRQDFRATVDARLAGQCPCTDPSAPGQPGLDRCADESSDYFVRVFRARPEEDVCIQATLEISNGFYDPEPGAI